MSGPPEASPGMSTQGASLWLLFAEANPNPDPTSLVLHSTPTSEGSSFLVRSREGGVLFSSKSADIPNSTTRCSASRQIVCCCLCPCSDCSVRFGLFFLSVHRGVSLALLHRALRALLFGSSQPPLQPNSCKMTVFIWRQCLLKAIKHNGMGNQSGVVSVDGCQAQAAVCPLDEKSIKVSCL